MATLKIIIERSEDAFWAYAEKLNGVTGAGDTVTEAKKSVLQGLALQIKLGNIPNKKYKIHYRFDTESLLNYYKGIFTNSALEKMTGINQKQIQHYASGLKKPRPGQTKKIEKALHNLGQELLMIEL
ncbi:MAG: hypothetical protein U0T11_07765 [Chitinophagaceae bacterium]